MYEGLQGSGKSYEMVNNVVIPNLKKGTRIITNIPLEIHEIETEYFHVGALLNAILKITPENFKELISDPENYKNSVILIDECHEFFWSHNAITDTELLKFFAMHRHYACHIILATQDRNKVAKKVVNEIQFFHVTLNYSALGLFKCYMYLEYFAKQKKPSHRALKFYKKSKYKFYRSFDPSVAKDIGTYTSPRKSGFNVWLYIALFVGVILYAKYSITNLGSSREEEAEIAEVLEETIVEKEEPNETEPPNSNDSKDFVLFTKNGPLTVNEDWIINGMVDLGDQKRYILKSPDGQTKVVWSVSEIPLLWNDPVKNQSKFPNRKF